MMYSVFDSIEEFNDWHDEIKIKLNFPIYGTNHLTGEIDYNSPTTEFTEPLINLNDQRVIANVFESVYGLNVIDKSLEEWSDWFSKSNIEA